MEHVLPSTQTVKSKHLREDGKMYKDERNNIVIWHARTQRWHCEHRKQKNLCLACGGSSLCEHGKLHHYCRDCPAPYGGSKLCPHKKKKYICKDCRGAGICEHLKVRRFCRICKYEFCEHKIPKSRVCKECKKKSWKRKTTPEESAKQSKQSK